MHTNRPHGKNKEQNLTRIFGFLVLFGIAAVVVVVAVGWSKEAATKMASGFVTQAAIGNEFEIESSQIALLKSQNDGIKKFAQHMIDDHSKAAENLSGVLSLQPGIDAQLPANRLDAKHQALLDQLKDMSGPGFDKQYVADQVKAHDDAVKLFQGYAGDGDNAALKDFAQKTLPTLQSHQNDIHQIAQSI